MKKLELLPEIQKIYDTLTDRQKSFIWNYLSNGYNGTQAAISAGYSYQTANEQASQTLAKLNVRTIVNSLVKDAAVRHGLTHDDLFDATRKLLDFTLSNLGTPGATSSDLKGAIETAAKLTGANAPDKLVSKQDSNINMYVIGDEEALRARIEKCEKEL